MKVKFSDFTTKQEVHDYLLKNSKKKVIKVESRLLDQDAVVVEHSDDFMENCGDIKYYFEDDESLEINSINAVALFVRGNGKKILVDYVDNNDFEPAFISMINSELGLNFELDLQKFNCSIVGELTTDQINKIKNKLDTLCNEFRIDVRIE